MSKIPKWVSSYIGIPYTRFGRDRNGADCWGILCLVLNEVFGKDVPTYTGLGLRGIRERREASDFFMSTIGLWRPVRAGQQEPGDGILIRVLGVPVHVGIWVAPGLMLHSDEGHDSCLESYSSPKWSARIEGFYRYVGSQDD